MTPARIAKKKILVVDDDRSLRHMLCRILQGAGFEAKGVGDGAEALDILSLGETDLMLLDVGLPGRSGLEVLAELRGRESAPRVVIMTSDEAPETLLSAVRDQAYEYLHKPFPPQEIIDVARRALDAAPESLSIEVVSASPEWVELIVPCSMDVVERIEGFMGRLKADLPEKVRESIGQAFRELLINAIEWGGRLDPDRRVRISYLRAKRMLLYRIADPGPGFSPSTLRHAAVNNPEGKPAEHASVREEMGLRPGGFGLLLVRAMVDELIYNEKRNEVVFVKYLE